MSDLSKKRPYQRVTDAMEGVDDTLRETILYPNRGSVLGISEGDDFLVFTHAFDHDEKGQQARQIWIDNEVETLLAILEVAHRALTRMSVDARPINIDVEEMFGA